MTYCYFDHAASSFPKPEHVIESIADFMRNIAISPGHSTHSLARKSEEIVYQAKQTIAHFFGIKSINQLFFTLNASYAMNLVLQGVLQRGDQVIYSATEHNSIIRTLNYLADKKGIQLFCVPANALGEVDIVALESAIGPDTKLIVINHAANVTGQINPVEKIIAIAKKHRVQVAIDAVQTAGFLSIDVEKLGCDYLFFTGHKALLGPTGIGGAYVKNMDALESILVGGTGGNSAVLFHPSSMPEKMEAGTMHAMNLVGLAAGIASINQIGLAVMRAHKLELMHYCLENLKVMKEIIVYGNPLMSIANHTPVVSLNIFGVLPGEVAQIFDRDYGILVRSGLHCAPLIHKNLDSFPNGTIRISLGYSNTLKEMEYLMHCLQKVCESVC